MCCLQSAGIDFDVSFGKIQILIAVYEEMPMKIEKVNDNQIRCTLTKADLADRELKLSELAYGTEKAKGLFRDMMQQAALEFGFQAENIPLMIEAIPINAECIVLIITKVEDPEELDTRFARFAPEVDDSDDILEDGIEEDSLIDQAREEVYGLFKKLTEGIEAYKSSADKAPGNPFDKSSDSSANDKSSDGLADKKSNVKAEEKEGVRDKRPVPDAKMFRFGSLSEVIKLAVALKGVYDDKNSLYKDAAKGQYVLVVNRINSSVETFNKACNVLSEYGSLERTLPSREFYYKEHCECVISDNAIQKLSQVM